MRRASGEIADQVPDDEGVLVRPRRQGVETRSQRSRQARPAIAAASGCASPAPAPAEAVEFVRDVCDYAEDGTADKYLTTSQPLGKFVGHVLEPETVGAPSKPYAEAVAQWETLERFVESRLRQE